MARQDHSDKQPTHWDRHPRMGGEYKKHHFKIEVEYNGRSFKTDYWQPSAKMKVGDLRSCLEMQCMDATYGDLTIDEFYRTLCYENVYECLKAYNGCKETLECFKNLFINPYELGDYLREKYNL